VDIIVAIAALAFLSPLLLVVATAIKVAMGGPVMFSHRRIGCNGVTFECYKFRTMVADAEAILNRYLAENPDAADEWSRTRKLRQDPRVTMLGHFLRKTSLDEIPQLFNVLRGEMSCVGPRPIVASELAMYGPHAIEYLRARPGMTGMWQVSGRNDVAYDQRVNLDATYVRSWSLGIDFLILLKTIPAVISSRGTC
jgi:exopolysaccharide production protein ExoY